MNASTFHSYGINAHACAFLLCAAFNRYKGGNGSVARVCERHKGQCAKCGTTRKLVSYEMKACELCSGQQSSAWTDRCCFGGAK